MFQTGPRAHIVAGKPGEPVRTCTGCRERDLRSVLLRLVMSRPPTGESCLVVDVGRSKPGRGAWVHSSPHCVELAARRRSVARALRVRGDVDLSVVRDFIRREAEHG